MKQTGPFILYGKGNLGMLAKEVLESAGAPIAAIIDQHSAGAQHIKWKKSGLPIVVCIASEPWGKIFSSLQKKGWPAGRIRHIYDIFEQYPTCGITSGWIKGKSSKEDVKNIKDIRARLYDTTSKMHYRYFRRWHQKREGYESRKVWPIEPRESLPNTLADIEIRKTVFQYPDAPMEKVSIHAEGCELDTITLNMRIFQKYRPKIDVACYHSRDGLWKIEKTLMDNLPDYRWTFRLHAFQGQAAYTYGVPKEKA